MLRRLTSASYAWLGWTDRPDAATLPARGREVLPPEMGDPDKRTEQDGTQNDHEPVEN